MRIFWVMFWQVVLTVAVNASPVPVPPVDFASDQYVDRTGCVFLRKGEDWVGRLDVAGQPVCGFPPSLASRRMDPDTVSVLDVPDELPPPDPSRILAERLASGLRGGEFLADPRPAETRRDPPKSDRPSVLEEEISAIIENRIRVRASLSGQGDWGLCSRLGYRPTDKATPLLGGDVTRGLCPGMRAPTPQERILDKKAAEAVAQDGEDTTPPADMQKGDVAQMTSPVGNEVSTVIAARPIPRAVPPKVNAYQSDLERKPDILVERIPAAARYVQVGAYADDGQALETIRRLGELGYSTAQSYQQRDGQIFRLILAGPFDERQALIIALKGLRKEGYTHAIAR